MFKEIIMYNFYDAPSRKNYGSVKWDEMLEKDPTLDESIIPFSVADMELATPPEIIEGLQEFIKENPAIGYVQPTDSYCDAVVGWMMRHHRWKIENDWIVPTPGVIPALYLSINAFTSIGDGVIIMSPVYYPFRSSVERCGRLVMDNPLIFNEERNRYEINFEDLEEKAKDTRTRMLIFCSPHNPVGRVWTQEELEWVAKICIDNDILIVCDEIHFDLVLPGRKHTVFALVNEKIRDRCVICTAPSKTFNIAGLQISNIIIENKKLRDRFCLQMDRTGLFNLNYFGYKACEIAYNQCEEWLKQMLCLIDENHKLVERYIEEKIPELSVIPMEGTYLQWIDCRKLGMTPTELETFMQKKAKLYLDEGYIFGDGGKGFERINLACPTKYIQAALERLEEAVASLR